jgi:hypothetical protein
MLNQVATEVVCGRMVTQEHPGHSRQGQDHQGVGYLRQRCRPWARAYHSHHW